MSSPSALTAMLVPLSPSTARPRTTTSCTAATLTFVLGTCALLGASSLFSGHSSYRNQLQTEFRSRPPTLDEQLASSIPMQIVQSVPTHLNMPSHVVPLARTWSDANPTWDRLVVTDDESSYLMHRMLSQADLQELELRNASVAVLRSHVYRCARLWCHARCLVVQNIGSAGWQRSEHRP
jgi:hypothetical protein